MIRRWGELSLLTRFTVTGLSVTILIGLTLGWWLGRELERSALAQEAASAADAATLVLDPFLTPADFAGPMAPDRFAAVDALVHDRLLHQHIVRIKIWNANGIAVYSDDPAVVGQSAGDNDELGEALEGELATEISDLTKEENATERGPYSRLMEIYVPIRLGGSSVVGAYELYHDLSVVEPYVAAMQRSLWASLAAAFVVLYLALFGIVYAASQQLRRQTIELGRLTARQEIERMTGEFVSIVSHELRTPLTGVMGFAELLLAREADPEQRRSWLGRIHAEATRLSHLVEQLLDVSRIEQDRIVVEPRALDVVALIDDVLEPFQLHPEEGHTFRRQVSGPIPLVEADPEKLAQVLINLVSNAVKYSPKGGAVTVSVAPAGAVVRVSVADEGLGIPEEELPRLFGRFHRVHSSDRQQIRGSGLGLYITRQLVERQGGRVWAESAGPGRGSTFHLELPIARQTSMEARAAS